MNSPFSPTGGPDGSAGDEAELRSLLHAEADRQPPVSPDLRAGVDRRVRRHRVRVAGAVAPVVALVVVGGALLATRPATETVLDTAAAPTEQVAEETPATDTTIVDDGTTDETAVTDPAPAGATDCGTIELGPERVDPETGPINCFIDAFNADGDARLVVVTSGPDGGVLTQTVTTAPGKQIDIAVDGSLVVALPDIALGGSGGGLVPPEPTGVTKDCGTVTVTDPMAADQLSPSSTTMTCLLGLFTSGDAGGFTMIVNDATGGTLTARVDLASDKTLTMTINGNLTETLPAGLLIPSDLTDHLPPNGFGLDELGLGAGAGESMFPGGPHGN